MRNSYCVNFQHVIFRVHKIGVHTVDQEDMHRYIAGVLLNNGVKNIKVGGVADHVHILGEFSDKSLPDIVRQCKISATAWLKKRNPEQYAHFHWSRGFGSFSVSPGHVAKLKLYIANQPEHHRVITTRREIHQIMESYRVC